MMIALLLALALQNSPPSPAPLPQKPELPVLKAGLGPCAADFTVKDTSGAPVYLALIRTRVRYGFMSVKRMDVEVGTNSEGKARIEGLPDKAKPVAYEIEKDMKKGTAEQDVAARCQATFDIVL